MPIAIGLDIGTTTITALALDASAGGVVASTTIPNDADVTSPADAERGRSEWDARKMAQRGCEAVRAVVGQLQAGHTEVAGIGLTGQQHGLVLVDAGLQPVGPFIGWRDRRGLEPAPGGDETTVGRAERLAGAGAARRGGCRLAAGYLGVTLLWMREAGLLPGQGTACLVTDYVGSVLTGERPVTDPTMGASSGLFHAADRRWDVEAIRSLGLPLALFPEVREAGDRFGTLTADAARLTALPQGLPVFVGMGDNQASFLGSVADRDGTAQVNVGTGGQVGCYTDRIAAAAGLELRPFPRRGFLLVEAGLCGGRAYATLRRFFQETAAQMLGLPGDRPPYAVMNRLAEGASRGAGGLRCEPFFTGSRAEPGRRASWSNVSEENFTPANMLRALLEGMARAFHDGYRRIQAATGANCTRLVGAGNGLRENPVLAGILSEEFGLPLEVPAHREEAAFGAALTAAYGAGILPDLATAGRLIRYQHQPR